MSFIRNRFLFKFSLLTEQQTMLYRQFEEFIGISECMTLITIFRTQRDQLLHTVKTLKSSEMYMASSFLSHLFPSTYC